MGNWTLQNVTTSIRDRNDVYGNFYAVTFRLKYSSSTFGSFPEMPRLEWKETITMIERREGTWWQYIGDQYARDPKSQTFNTWVMRYPNAYYAVRQQEYGPDNTVRFYDSKGQNLPQDTFKRGVATPKEQAEVARDYLKRHGGILEITVVDKPGINKPTGKPTVHKERILTFDCGLRGSGMRSKGYQHLIVDGSVPEAQWRRDCQTSAISPPFSTAGLRQVQPPADVSIVKPYNGAPLQGEYL